MALQEELGGGRTVWRWQKCQNGTNPNLRSGLLLFPTTHVTVKLFAKRCKVGGKKMRKFTCKILLYNVWCILIGRGRLK